MDVLAAVMENVAFPFTRVIACTRKGFQHLVVNSPARTVAMVRLDIWLIE